MGKILTIDDSAMIRAVLTNFIKKSGHDGIEARDGSEGISIYTKEKPDLVFLDLLMPGIDGFKTLEEIKKINPEAKVVVVSSLKEPSDEKKAKDLKANDYITKPFSKDQIEQIIKKYVGDKK